MLVLGVHTLQDPACGPVRRCTAAREAVSTADVDVEAVFAWRDFMVSDYSDAGQERWLADHHIDLLRGTGRLAGPGVVEVDGVRHTADHIVLANGADPVVPPVSGLRDLEGIWGSREATSMKAVPRRLVILGGGPVGVEMGQVVRRLGGEVVITDMAEHLLGREPAPLGEALGEVLQGEGIELVLSANAVAARRDGDDYVLELDDGRELKGDRILVATGRRPRVRDIGLDTVGVDEDAHGVPVDAHLRAAEGLWAIGDVNGLWPLTHVGKYQGEVVAANILGTPRKANYEAVPRVVYTDPQAAAVGATAGRFSAMVPLTGIAKTATYTRDVCRQQGVPDAPQRWRTTDRGLRARTRGGRVDAAGHAGHPRPHPTRRPRRHDSAIPDLLGDLRGRAERPPPRDRGRVDVGRHGTHHGQLRSALTWRSSVDRKVAIVTGGSQGIGAGIAEGYRDKGWTVVGTARSFTALPDPAFLTVAGDLADPSTADRIVDETLATFGRIDTLVNNAGVYLSKPFVEYTADDYAAVVGRQSDRVLPADTARHRPHAARGGARDMSSTSPRRWSTWPTPARRSPHRTHQGRPCRRHQVARRRIRIAGHPGQRRLPRGHSDPGPPAGELRRPREPSFRRSAMSARSATSSVPSSSSSHRPS